LSVRKLVILILLLAVQSAGAESEQAQLIAEKLRCLVCQNQTIAESDAPLALDLRRQVREQLAQGKSEQEVLAFMVARYGDFVLYKPPLKPMTLPLWFGPLFLLAGGVALLYRAVRRNALLTGEGRE
jgi:cytochrome c-type biogenesis protein CcmH